MTNRKSQRTGHRDNDWQARTRASERHPSSFVPHALISIRNDDASSQENPWWATEKEGEKAQRRVGDHERGFDTTEEHLSIWWQLLWIIGRGLDLRLSLPFLITLHPSVFTPQKRGQLQDAAFYKPQYQPIRLMYSKRPKSGSGSGVCEYRRFLDSDFAVPSAHNAEKALSGNDSS